MRFKLRLSSFLCCLVMAATGLVQASDATLRPGDEGDRVAALQQALIGQGYPIEVDGKYGRRTQVAVTAFQRARGLNTDGVAGSQTLGLLLGGGALTAAPGNQPDGGLPEGGPVAAPSPLVPEATPAETDQPSAQVPADTPGRFELGSQGPGVVSLQQRLLALGYDSGRADGVFDAGTQAAVRAYQRAHGLSADGIAGAKTLASLYALPVQTAPQPDAAAGTPGPQVPALQGSAQAIVATGNTGGLRLRSSMSAVGSRNVVASLRNGQQVNIIGVQGEWAQVEAGNHRGYVISRFLQVGTAPAPAPETPQLPPEQELPQDVPPAPQLPAPAATRATVQTANGGSLRMRGSMDSRTSANVLRALANGTALEVVNHGPQWCQVLVDGQLGYVMTSFLRFETAPPPENPDQPAVPDDDTPEQDDEGPLFPRTLRAGDNGPDVSALQSRLEALRYSVTESGHYDQATQQAVRLFQEQNSLRGDGVFGPLTAHLLLSPDAKANPQALPDFTTLRMGSQDGQGRAVTMLQTALQGLGFQLAVDGSFGAQTHDAVVAFQQRNNLTVSGDADPDTQRLLYAGGANGAAAPPLTPDVDAAPGQGPGNAQVKLLDWDSQVKPQIKSGQVAQVYHPDSGISFDLRYYSLGRHADSEPLTLKDTQLMNQALGDASWDTRTVYVKMPSGEWALATMHNYPHLYGSVKDNGFSGHLCVHFKRDLEETKKVSPKYGMQNQRAIRQSWQNLTGVAVN